MYVFVSEFTFLNNCCDPLVATKAWLIKYDTKYFSCTQIRLTNYIKNVLKGPMNTPVIIKKMCSAYHLMVHALQG